MQMWKKEMHIFQTTWILKILKILFLFVKDPHLNPTLSSNTSFLTSCKIQKKNKSRNEEKREKEGRKKKRERERRK